MPDNEIRTNAPAASETQRPRRRDVPQGSIMVPNPFLGGVR